MMYDLVIVGAGASGLVAAIAAHKENPNMKICLLEQKDQMGKKILATGNGRCNFTNEQMGVSYFHSDTPSVVMQVLEKFGTKETLNFFQSLGIYPKSKNGYYYPRSEQASAILNVLKLAIEASKTEIKTGVHISEIRKGRRGFTLFGDSGKIDAKCVILATGGKASKVLGSDGSGYALAKSLGHSLVPVVPALVQLRTRKHSLLKASGVRTEAKVSIYADGTCLASDTGELQITAYGISGIPVFQVSRHAAKALYENQKVQAELDFFPSMDEQELFSFYKELKNTMGDFSIADALVGVFNQKLIPCLLKCANIKNTTFVSELSDQQIESLAFVTKHLRLQVEDTNGFDNAQVCAGGVRLDEICPDTMESLCCDRLYLTGELLDADGICGGYNLQWAWATGYLAGISAGKKCSK